MTELLEKPFPTRYHCDPHGLVEIAFCPPFISGIGNKPAYWYLVKDLHVWEPGYRSHWQAGFRHLYWAGDVWALSTPIQFPTVEAAWEEFTKKLRK